MRQEAKAYYYKNKEKRMEYRRNRVFGQAGEYKEVWSTLVLLEKEIAKLKKGENLCLKN